MTRAETAEAKATCRGCQVQRECLKAALSAEETWGVWGGYSAPERKRAVEEYGTTDSILEAFDAGILSMTVVRRGE